MARIYDEPPRASIPRAAVIVFAVMGILMDSATG
jgi:hypothetical protein